MLGEEKISELSRNLNILFIVISEKKYFRFCSTYFAVCFNRARHTDRQTNRLSSARNTCESIDFISPSLFLSFVHDFLVSNQISSKKLFARSFARTFVRCLYKKASATGVRRRLWLLHTETTSRLHESSAIFCCCFFSAPR